MVWTCIHMHTYLYTCPQETYQEGASNQKPKSQKTKTNILERRKEK